MNIQCLLFCVFVNSDPDKIPYSRNNRCCKWDWILKIIPEILNHRFYSHEKSVQKLAVHLVLLYIHMMMPGPTVSNYFVSSVLYSFLLSPHPDHTLFAVFCKYKHFFPWIHLWNSGFSYLIIYRIHAVMCCLLFAMHSSGMIYFVHIYILIIYWHESSHSCNL